VGRRGQRRTEKELFNGRKDVDAQMHLELVDLELEPFAEGFEVGGHGGDGWWW
jgi:hypothetical protein